MTKLMLAIGLLAALVLIDPPRVLGHFGPGAHRVGWKIKNALEVSRYVPNLRSIGL
jgi:hypothetical protein